MSIAVVGLGEAGRLIAAGLANGGSTVTGFDPAVLTDTAVAAELASVGVAVCSTVGEAVTDADVVLALTSATAAEATLRSVAPFLASCAVYCDLNSTSPATARRLAELAHAHDANLVDGAMLEAVPGRGHRVPMVVSGERAEAIAAELGRAGADVRVIGNEVGTASAMKMVRSLAVKGFEALLAEVSFVGAHWGVTDEVLHGIDIPGASWLEQADYLAGRTIAHGSRRAAELREAADAAREAGVEPLVAEAAARRLELIVEALAAAQIRPTGRASMVATIRSSLGTGNG